MKTVSVKDQIVGTWKLISIYYKDQNGEKVNLYGENPIGILMYDKYGYMNAQLGFCKRENLSSASLSGGSDEEKVKAFDSYMAYYGKYYEKEPGVIVHEVEGCSIPNWVGGDETRYVRIDNDFLYIFTPQTTINGLETVIEVVWGRC